ncbi:DMT family transporter [Pacificoceanicola onchidii]|uniref:DMT family transporter n=1 Tax=Pacificoceanicola onchidii TaxID=2562685 RepID=UPI0010A5DA10|nr:DMT family transporter [Pacificoceanicola onchidii]
MQPDRPLLGIALMLGFCALAPLADALAKMLGPLIAVGQLVFLRFILQALILLPITLATRRPMRTDRRSFFLIALRTLLHIAGIATVFTALLYLPLADAIAIAYVMPFIMLLLGHYVLGEEVGWHRLSACAVGFIGTLLVIQPAFDDVGWPALLPLAVAFIFAAFMLVTRQIAQHTDPIGMQALSALLAVALLGPLMLAFPGVAALAWTPPTQEGWGLILAMGFAGTFAHLLMTWSLRYAPAATLAPMQYLEIPIATLFGWILFKDLPGPLAALGIAVTMAAGLYVILRERASLSGQRAGRPEAHQGTPPAG